jgi:hypothetical protein
MGSDIYKNKRALKKLALRKAVLRGGFFCRGLLAEEGNQIGLRFRV